MLHAGASFFGCDHVLSPITLQRDCHLPSNGPNETRQFASDRGGDAHW